MVADPPELTDGGVAGDPEDPRVERPSPFVEAGRVSPHALEGLLHDVVGRGVARYAASDRSYRRPQPRVHVSQRVVTPGRDFGHDSTLVH